MSSITDLIDAAGVIERYKPLINSRGALEHRRRVDPSFPKPLQIPHTRRLWWSQQSLDDWLQLHVNRGEAA